MTFSTAQLLAGLCLAAQCAGALAVLPPLSETQKQTAAEKKVLADAAAEKANELGLGINAGHDLDLQNLQYFAQHIPGLLEVSIGHALICDALYLGLENTVQLYKRCLSGGAAYVY